MIVEDSRLVAEDIASKLRAHDLEIAGIYDTGEAAISSLAILVPDLILMDISLAGAMDGISTAHLIGEKHAIPLIYLTDLTDEKTLARAKLTMPANYLVKPFLEPDLIRAIDLAFSNAQQKKESIPGPILPEYIFVRSSSQVYLKIAYQDILFLKADRVYCELVTVGKTHVLSTSMNHVHDQLGHPDFIKVHRSYVVNVNKIDAIEGRMIKIGDHSIQMNAESYDELMGRVKLIKVTGN